VFFLPEGEFFIPLAYFWQNLDQKNIRVAKKSSILTFSHPFEPIFIHFQGFHPTSG
jgi:hypothetical protein